MPQAPQHKVSCTAMPQSDEYHCADLGYQDNQPTACSHCCIHQSTTQRCEKIVPKPGRKRDMPAIPECGDVALHIRIRKIFWQSDTSEQTDANGNIGVARKIKIKLKGIGIEHDPQGKWFISLADQLWTQGDISQCICQYK